jgi:Zn-dependent protease
MSESDVAAPPQRLRCGGCGTELPPNRLACPACHTLVHRERLARIAADADAAEAAGDPGDAEQIWRSALPLLPRNSAQFDEVARRVEILRERAPRRGASNAGKWKAAGGIGATILALLSKGKLLLLGFAKLPTLLSMLAFTGVFWHVWGWKFAVAFVLGIYVHEMGHVHALRARGVPATAPMFIPGFGAFVRMHAPPSTPREDARIGLAGPMWGLAVAVGTAITFAITRNPFWSALTTATALLNLFNLTPVWQLDGSRGFASQTSKQRWLIVAIIAIAGALTLQRMLGLVGIVAIWRALQKDAPRIPDWGAFARFALLTIALAALSLLSVSGR